MVIIPIETLKAGEIVTIAALGGVGLPDVEPMYMRGCMRISTARRSAAWAVTVSLPCNSIRGSFVCLAVNWDVCDSVDMGKRDDSLSASTRAADPMPWRRPGLAASGQR